jgi:predicted SnoaL-like aldol condensation-catalyzing enzyme
MNDLSRETALKAKTIALFGDVLTLGNAEGLDRFFADAYQPRCAPFLAELAPGLDALRGRLAGRGAVPHRLYRLIADGDFVFAHLRYDGPVPVAGIDIFRFDADDRIAEHWNVRQVLPHDIEKGWDRFAGDGDATSAIDEARRTEMKELLKRSQLDVWGNARADLVSTYYDRSYVQHNPDMPGGFDRIQHLVETEMKAYLEKTGGPFPIDFHLLGANGDLVFVYYSVPMAGIGRKAGEKSRNADIFRIDGRNKLIEHWDVLQIESEPLPNDLTLL